MSRPRHLPNVRWFSWLRRGWPSIRGPALEYTIPSTSGNLRTEPQIKSLLSGDVVWQDWFWSAVRINNETVYRQRGGSNWLYKVLFFIWGIRFRMLLPSWYSMAGWVLVFQRQLGRKNRPTESQVTRLFFTTERQVIAVTRIFFTHFCVHSP